MALKKIGGTCLSGSLVVVISILFTLPQEIEKMKLKEYDAETCIKAIYIIQLLTFSIRTICMQHVLIFGMVVLTSGGVVYVTFYTVP